MAVLANAKLALRLLIGGDTRTDAPHEKQHRDLGEVMKKTIKSVHGMDYTCVLFLLTLETGYLPVFVHAQQ